MRPDQTNGSEQKVQHEPLSQITPADVEGNEQLSQFTPAYEEGIEPAPAEAIITPVQQTVTFVKRTEAPKIVDLTGWKRPLISGHSADRSEWQAVTVADYQKAEKHSLRLLSIPALMAFQPASFQSVGWPTQVSYDEELVRYVDHNFEAEVPALYEDGAKFTPIGFENAFTPKEAELLEALRDLVASLTKHRFGRSVRPMSNLMVQIGPFRCIEALSAQYGRKLAIFEPGPGAGYLGALLAQKGYTYGSYDVTQSLYLWQSHLLDVATAGKFVELAKTDELTGIDRTSVLHMPWWMFALQLGATPLRYDLVYSNSNLGEMTPVALRQLILYSKLLLDDSEVGAFAFFSAGMPRYHTLETIDQNLQSHGFVPVMTTPFYCYQLPGRDSAPIRQAFEDGIPFIGGQLKDANLSANSVFSTPENEEPIDIKLSRWFFEWDAPITKDKS